MSSPFSINPLRGIGDTVADVFLLILFPYGEPENGDPRFLLILFPYGEPERTGGRRALPYAGDAALSGLHVGGGGRCGDVGRCPTPVMPPFQGGQAPTGRNKLAHGKTIRENRHGKRQTE
jgi:hypothetical protein